MPTRIRETSFEGQPALVLESDRARAVVLPRISGKIASFVDVSTDEELLWRNPDRPYREPTYAAAWSAYDMSGWEDCFPTVAASTYPAFPWQGIQIPEHGEVWSLPWEARVDGAAVELTVHGLRLPYHFTKRISLDGPRVRLQHRVHNPSAFPIQCIWATHPLFRVTPETRIVLPPGVHVHVDWSRDARLGQRLDSFHWPGSGLDTVGDAAGYADKLYAQVDGQGWCGLAYPGTGRIIALRFDPRSLPYVGIWINRGGWPLNGPPSYNVALEPTSGPMDLLDVAHSRGEATCVDAGEEREWTVEMCFGKASSVQALLEEQ